MATENTVDILTSLDTRPAIKSLSDFKRAVKDAFKHEDPRIRMNGLKRDLADATREAKKLKDEYDKFASGAKTPDSVKSLTKELLSAQNTLSKVTADYAATVNGNPTNKHIKELQKDLAKAEAEASKLKAQYENIKEGKFTSADVKEAKKDLADAQKEATKLEKELAKAVKQFELMSGKSGYTDEQLKERSLEVGGKTLYVGAAGNRINPTKMGDKWFDTADKDFDKVRKIYEEIKRLEQELSVANQNVKSANAGLFAKIGEEADSTVTRINGANTRIQDINNQLLSAEQAQEQEVTSLTNIVSQLNTAVKERKDAELQNAADAAQRAGQEAAELNDELREMNDAPKKSKHIAVFFDNIAKKLKNLSAMMKRMTIRLIFYQTFGKAIRSTVDYIKQAVAADAELSRSVGILKGNILTAFQQIYTILRPIILAIVKLITLIIGTINNLIALLTGRSVKSAQDAAKAMLNLGKATGGAGKEAKKTLASFDELIQIGDKSKDAGGADTSIQPEFVDPEQFRLSDNIREALKAIAGLLAAILVIILLIKGALGFLSITSSFLQHIWGILKGFGSNGILTTIAGIILIIAGTLLLIKTYSDAWVNGLNWENFAGVLAALAMIVAGLVLVFGTAVLPLALIGSGIALIVLGVRDLIKNGPTMQNQLLIFIGLITLVVGLIMSGHAALGLIVLAIGAAILIAGNFGEQWENIMTHCGDIVSGFVNLVTDLINGDFDKAWEDAKGILKGFGNLGIDIFEGLVKAGIKAVNKLIDAINSLSFGPIPDWVPGIGGKEFSLNIPKINSDWSLPRLAQGAVIPPNKEFMAVLGDQKHGTNIETPLSTMIDAFNTALDSRGGGSNTINIKFEGSLAQLARVLKPYIEDDEVRQGAKRSNGLIVGGNY